MTPKPPKEQHANISKSRLNALRAAVLGANDGIVSTAGIVVGVAGATDARTTLATAGIAGLVAGTISMAAGEYISVSSQRDTEMALLAYEQHELATYPDEEFEELVGLYRSKGVSSKTARLVAKELTAHDVFAAHADAELKIDPNDLNNPWHAAVASASSFLIGGLIPVLAILVSPARYNVVITFVAVLLALTLTGYLSASVGGAHRGRAVLRVVAGGLLAMIVTNLIGRFVGSSVH